MSKAQSMPSNKNAHFRYQVFDECFTTPGHRRWTKAQLIERISKRLQEAGFAENIGIRQFHSDIKYLREQENAPIVTKDGHYFYADSTFSLKKSPFKPEEIKLLQEAFALLQQFPNLPHLDALKALLLKMNWDTQHIDLTAQIIQFESNPAVQGLEWLGKLYAAITQQRVLSIHYQPFNAPAETIIFHPYLLKEWRNRWYVVGRHQVKQAAWNLALDRIQAIHPSNRPFLPNDLFDPLTRYQDVIGVTVNEQPVQEIVFRCRKNICGYLHTKPLHHSQRLIESTEVDEVFSIRVIPNAEVYGELYRFGKDLEVVKDNR